MYRCKCNNERAAMKIRAILLFICILFLLAGCGPKTQPLVEQVKPAATLPQNEAQHSEAADGNASSQAANATVGTEAIPRWISQPVLPCASTDINEKTDGLNFYMNSIRITQAKDTALMAWLNSRIEAFEKEIITDNSAIDGFLHTLALTGYGTKNAVENRTLSFQPCLSGNYFSLLCNENISNTEHYESSAHTRTWDLKQKKQVLLKDLFDGTDYIESINSHIRRQLCSTESEEWVLKRPFDGIDGDYSLFCFGPGMGQGARYGMTHLEFIFPEDNPYFTYLYTVSIPLYDLRQLLKPETMGDSPLTAGVEQSKLEYSAYAYSLPARIMPDTQLCETEAMETKESNVSRREVMVAEMADGGVMAKINSQLKEFYAAHSNQKIKEAIKRAVEDKKAAYKDHSQIRVQPKAEEFGGFLLFQWEVYVYSNENNSNDGAAFEEVLNSLFQSERMYFDLATGKKLTLADILSPEFYQTKYYNTNKDKISMKNFGLSYEGIIEFYPKDSKTELVADDGRASRCFDWEKWKTIGGESSQRETTGK